MQYILSDIPGFNDIIGNNIEVNDNQKYFNVIEYSTKSNEKYKIVRYAKELLSTGLIQTYGLLRSVIINSQDKIVSFAPPKSIPVDIFMQMNPAKTEHITAEEFVEGTMINVFFDTSLGVTGGWQIATRNTAGGNVSFYKTSTSKTFNQMFLEACLECNLYINTLNPLYCYSFVLQHPTNRIVIPVKYPQLYLVEVYEIKQIGNSVEVFVQNIENVKKMGFWNLTKIKFPEIYEFSSYSDLIEKYASPNTPYNIMGVIIKHDNVRCKIRNPIYEEVRHLKGNQPKLQYQYLALRREGKIPEFLKIFPETKHELSGYRDQVHMFTNTLHKNYLSCYVKKEKPLKEFSNQYRTHMYKLHEIYITELKPKDLFVTNTIVIKYVNELPAQLLMYTLNYNLRNRMVDTIKAEDKE
jgi:hypothetical protein